jgi:cell volume regulation protein A
VISAEPMSTGLLLAGVGFLLLLSAGFSRVSRVLGLPVVLLFLAVGMLAGSEGPGRIHFEDYGLTFRIGTAALALILFDGGLNTSLRSLRQVWAPAASLATAGVLATSVLVALGVHAIGFSWGEALLLGAIVSSTDAAVVFSVLRGGRIQPRASVATLLEAESGLNDPMAVMLTLGLTRRLVGQPLTPGSMALEIAGQLVLGCGLGFLIGLAGSWLMRRVRPAASGLYPVMSLALAALAFGLPTVLSGSGFLAVYVAGIVIGNGPLPHRAGTLRVHDAVAWLSQIVMFLALGLLVFPHRLVAVAPIGLVIALLLAVIVRPAAVLLALAPFRIPLGDRLIVGWLGMRGAVPIILGTYPVLAGVAGGERIFDIVFFVVVISVLLQGGTARWAIRRSGAGALMSPAPATVLEISSTTPLRGDVMSFLIDIDTAVCGAPLREIPFPPESGPILVIRGDALMAADAETVLEAGDHLYVFARPIDRPMLELLIGRPEDV